MFQWTSMQPVWFCSVKDKQVAKKAAAADITLIFHVAKHHQSFNAANCTSKLNAKIFDDSTMAYKFGRGKTKTETIVCNVLAAHILDIIHNFLEKYSLWAFSLMPGTTNITMPHCDTIFLGKEKCSNKAFGAGRTWKWIFRYSFQIYYFNCSFWSSQCSKRIREYIFSEP